MSESAQFESWLWILLALGLGALVGLEREWRGHEAGIRTTALVCAGAALFGQLSSSYGDSRIAAGVVQGVGFLGAGLVFQRRHDVRGVTTAATIWVVAAVGLLVASELWLTATLVTLSIVALLELAPLSDIVFHHGRRKGGQAGRRSLPVQPSEAEDASKTVT